MRPGCLVPCRALVPRPHRVPRPPCAPLLLGHGVPPPQQQTIATRSTSCLASGPPSPVLPTRLAVGGSLPRIAPNLFDPASLAARFASTPAPAPLAAGLRAEEQYNALQRRYPEKMRSLQPPRKLISSDIAPWQDELRNRVQTLDVIRDIINKRWTAPYNSRALNPLLGAIGAPGIGKSRLGDEVHAVVQQAHLPPIPKETRITVTRTFSSGTKLPSWPEAADGVMFCAAILIRSALLPGVSEDDLVPVLSQLGVTSMEKAMEVVRYAALRQQNLPHNTPVAVTLVFDELQGVLARGVHAIRTFTTEFADLQLAFERPAAEHGGLFVTTMFIGTSDEQIIGHSVRSPFKLLPLPLLSLADSERLAEVALNGGRSIEWEQYNKLRHALWLCGGWPRMLQYLLNEILELHEPLESLKEFRLFRSVVKRVVALWTERYGFSQLSPRFMQYLMAATVLRRDMNPSAPLPVPLPGVNTCTTRLLKDVAFFWPLLTTRYAACAEVADDSPNAQSSTVMRRVFVPALVLADWSKSIDPPDARELTDVLDRLQQPTTVRWQTAEVEMSQWLALRLGMFQWLGLPTLDLSLLLGGAAPVLDKTGRQVRLAAPATPRLVPWPRRWPSKVALPAEMLDGRHVVLLGAGSPAIDVVAPLRDEDGGLFWLCLQIRSTQTQKAWLTEADVTEDLREFDEHLKELPPTQQPVPARTLFVYVTNRRIDFDAAKLEEREKRLRFIHFDQLGLLPPGAAERLTQEERKPSGRPHKAAPPGANGHP